MSALFLLAALVAIWLPLRFNVSATGVTGLLAVLAWFCVVGGLVLGAIVTQAGWP